MSTKDYLEKDYYQALGVASDASAADIKKAYRKLARQYHPDANPGDAAAESRFKEVSEAHDVLSNADRRKEYDETRSLFAGGGGSGGLGGFAGFPSGGAGSSTPFTFGDIFSGAGDATRQTGSFGDLFGGLFGGRNARRTGAEPMRGTDVEAELTLRFDDAVSGLIAPLELSSPHTCATCQGSGARPGTTPRTCPNCGGTGFATRNQGAFAFSEPCRDCRGTGKFVDDPCPDCGGTGAVTGVRHLTVRIPAGVKDGQRIRIPGKGAPGGPGGQPGDLYVRVHVATHPLFGRDGDNLTLTLPISFTESALGATVRVPTMRGVVSLKLPPGTQSGKTFRVRGRGMSTRSRTGDLLVTVEVAVPRDLSDDAKRALRSFAASDTADPRPRVTAEVNKNG